MNGFKQYKFSIIIPNYNGADFLEGCLNSILSQNYTNYEVIIIDGKSTDNSHKIISEFQEYSNKINWIQKKDNGISSAFNLGLKETSGDFILYLGSDDYLYNEILFKLNQYINRVLGYKLLKKEEINIFCDSINYLSINNNFVKRVFPTKQINKKNLIKYGNLIGLQNIILNSFWIKKNLLDVNNKYSMDYEVYFRMLNSNQLFLFFPEVNAINYHGENISTIYSEESFQESIKIAYKHSNNIIDSIYILKRKIIYKIIKNLKY